MYDAFSNLFGKITSNKTFYWKLAADWDLVYKECLELFPEPSDFLDGTTFKMMPALYKKLKELVDSCGTYNVHTRIKAQEIVDEFNDNYWGIGVWTTLKSNHWKLYSFLQNIGVAFYKFEDKAETNRLNLIDALNK